MTGVLRQRGNPEAETPMEKMSIIQQAGKQMMVVIQRNRNLRPSAINHFIPYTPI